MLGKNNFKERLRKMDEKHDRFSIRKLTIGAASVLIGSVLFGLGVGSNQVKADTSSDTILAASTNKADKTSAASEKASSEPSKPQTDVGVIKTAHEEESKLAEADAQQKQEQGKVAADQLPAQSTKKPSAEEPDTKQSNLAEKATSSEQKNSSDAEKDSAADSTQAKIGDKTAQLDSKDQTLAIKTDKEGKADKLGLKALAESKAETANVTVGFKDTDDDAGQDSDAVKQALAKTITLTGNVGDAIDFATAYGSGKIKLPDNFELDDRVPWPTGKYGTDKTFTIDIKHKRNKIEYSDNNTIKGLTRQDLFTIVKRKIIFNFPKGYIPDADAISKLGLTKNANDKWEIDQSLAYKRTGYLDLVTNQVAQKIDSDTHKLVNDYDLGWVETDPSEGFNKGSVYRQVYIYQPVAVDQITCDANTPQNIKQKVIQYFTNLNKQFTNKQWILQSSIKGETYEGDDYDKTYQKVQTFVEQYENHDFQIPSYDDGLVKADDIIGLVEVASPSISGYTASTTTVPLLRTGDLSEEFYPNMLGYDKTVTVDYKADPRKATYTFVDDDENGAQVGSTITVNGVTDQKDVATNLTVPTNHVLASGQTLPASVDFGTTDPANVTIHLKHETKKITEDNIPTGAKNSDGSNVTKSNFEKKIKRTITAREPNHNGGTTDHDLSQTITITQSATYDEVTGKVTYNGDWSKSTFVEVNAPSIAGYTPSKTSVAEVNNVSSNYTDPKIVITYRANAQHINYQFVDDDNKGSNVGSLIEVDGTTDETIDLSQKVKLPAGYDLASGQTIPTSVKLTVGTNGTAGTTVTIHVKHHIITVKASDIPSSGKIAGDNGHKTKGDGKSLKDISKDDLSKTLTRTVEIHYPAGHSPSFNYIWQAAHWNRKVTFERQAKIDDVTGKVTYTTWTVPTGSPSEFSAVPMPDIGDGYKANHADVPAYTPKASEVDTWQDPNIQVYFNPEYVVVLLNDTDPNASEDSDAVQEELQKYKYILKGDYGTKADFSKLVLPSGFELDPKYAAPSYTFHDAADTSYTVYVRHRLDKNIDQKHNPSDSNTKTEEFNKAVKRTITAQEPKDMGWYIGKNNVDLSQTATLTRTGTYDEVLKKILSWNSWQNGTFAAVTAPKVDGYTAKDNATIASDIATPDYKDPKLVITYTADSRKAVYTFVDDDENGIKLDPPITVTGVTNDSALTGLHVPVNYVLATGQKLPSTVKFGAKDIAETIHLKHKKDNITENDIPILAENPNGSDVEKSNFEKQIKRTISAKEPQGDGTTKNKDLSQTITLTQSAYFDFATNKVIKYNGDWSKGTFAKVDAPSIAGYTPSQTSVAEADNVSSNYTDTPVVITYTANAQSVGIKFVDDDDNGSQVGSTITKNGATDSTLTDFSDVTVPTNYKLATGQSLPSSYKFTADTNQTITIHLVHATKQISEDNIPTGAKNSDGSDITKTNFEKEIKRTIVAKEPNHNGGTTNQDLSQTITIKQTGTYDEVTGKVNYNGDWSKGTFDAVTAPQIDGYTSKINGTAAAKVDAVTDVGADYVDPQIDITYTANTQYITYQLVDDDDDGSNVGSAVEVDGLTDETINLSSKINVPAGYELVTTIPTSVKLTADNPNLGNTVKIHLKHHIDNDITKTPDAGAKDQDGSIISDSDFSKTVKRTITVTKPDGSQDSSLSQTATLTRTGNYDEVTKVLIWNNWTTESFNAVDVPQIAGYTSKINGTAGTKIDAVVSVGANYSDPKISITYSANDQYIKYQFVDDNKGNINVGNAIKVDGKTDETVNPSTKVSVPAGYQLNIGQSIPTSVKLSMDNSDLGKTVEIHLVHGSKLINPGDVISKGTDPTKGQPNVNVQKSDSEHTLKRIITVTNPNGEKTDIVQTIDFNRTGSIDTVTGVITWDAWKPADSSKDSFALYDAPAIDGYSADKTAEAETKVTYSDGQADETVKIGYTANNSDFNIVYKDDKGNTISNKNIAGKTDGTVPSNSISNNIPAGWVIEGTAPTLPAKFVPQDKQQDITVNVKHGTKTIQPDDVTKTEPITGDKGDKKPGDGKPQNDIDYSDLHKDITRTITDRIPGQALPTVTTQKVSYERTATIDDVTGDVTYGDWTVSASSAKKNLGEYDVKEVDGYTVSQTEVDAETPTSEQVDSWSDPNISITYTANGSTFHVIFKDEKGNVVNSGNDNQIFTGVTDGAVTGSIKLPAGWVAVDTKPLLPTKFAPQDKENDITVTVKHGSKKINPGEVISAGTDPTKGQPKRDVKASDSQHTLNRVITVTNPNGSINKPITQSIAFQRIGHIDMVTGEVTWDAWQPADSTKDSFAKYDAPTIDGYTADNSAKALSDVTYKTGDQDLTVTIGYTANASSFTVHYIDAQGSKVNSGSDDQEFDGKTDANVTTDKNGKGLTLPAGWVTADGEDVILPKTFVAKDKENDMTVTLKHGTITVKPSDVTKTKPIAGDKGNKKPGDGKPANDINYADLHRDMTRMVIIGDAGQTKGSTDTETIHYERTVTVDDVTGEVTYSDWTVANGSEAGFKEVDVPAIAGYTPSETKVYAKTPDQGEITNWDQDETERINYTANDQSVNYQFVDDDENGANVGAAITKNGMTDQTVNFTLIVPSYYKLANNQTLPTDYTFKASGNDLVKIHLVHKIDRNLDKAHTPAGALEPDGTTPVKDSDYSEDIKRTITIKEPDHNGGTTEVDKSETVTLTRTGNYDEVSKKMSWNPWSTDTFKQVDVPMIAGYTASQNSIASDTAKDGYVDPQIVVIYTANAQYINYQLVDDDTKDAQGKPTNVGSFIEVDGVTDGTINPSSKITVPAGYDVVTTIPTSVKLSDDNQNLGKTVQIHLKHHIDKDLTKIPSSGTHTSDGKTIEDTDFSEEVTRTITAKEPTGDVDLSQQITLHRTGNFDEITKVMTFNSWSTATFKAVDAPVVAGYTPDQTTIASDTAKDGYVDPKIVINYTANSQSETIKFIDDDKNGAEIGNDHVLNGVTDQAIDTNLTKPAGYDLATGNSIPKSYTFKASDNTPIIIHFVHHIDKGITKITNPGTHTSDGKKVTDDDFSETITRTITAHEPTGDVDLSQHKTITRTGDYDEVTKVITWNVWSTTSFDAVNSPKVNGYKANQDVVPAVLTVTDGYIDPKVEISYTAQGQHINYQFYDDTDKENVGNAIEVSGKTDETVDPSMTVKVPAGYDLTKGQTIPNSIKLTADNPLLNTTVAIHLVHHIDKGIDEDHNPKDSTTDVRDFSQTVTRTITAHEPQADGTFKDVDLSQHVTLSRTGDYDEVLKKIVSWHDWSTDSFSAVTAPKLDGYTAQDNASIAADTAKDGYVDPRLVITYSADSRKATFTFVDDDDNESTINTAAVNGVTNQKGVVTGLTLPTHYVLADGQTLPTTIDFGTSDLANVKIHLKHKVDNNLDQSHMPTDATETDGKTPVSNKDYSKDVIRTITIQEPDHNGGTTNVDKSQTVTLTRTGNYDEVTKKVTWNTWTTGSFNSVNVPVIAGYTPSQSIIGTDTAKDGYKDPQIVVTYTANRQYIDYQLVDDDEPDKDGNPLNVGNPVEVDGATDGTINPSSKITVPAGYDVVTTIPTGVKLTADNPNLGKTVKIHLKHHIDKAVTKTPAGGATNPDGSAEKDTDFSEQISRTITAKEPQADGTTKDVDLSEHATITRIGNFDEVTKKMTWNAWGTAPFAEVTAPSVDGYTPDKATVAADTAVDGYKDPKIVINYRANPQSETINFYDDTDKKQISTKTLSGSTDQTINTDLTAPAGYDLATGNSIPATYKFKAEGNASITVYFVHHIDKGIIKTQNPHDHTSDGKKVIDDDFSETITRTITAHEPTGDVDLSQHKTITRSGDYDEVTHVITWNNWSTTSFDAVNAPKVNGYKASQDTVDAANDVTDGYVDPKVEINYTAQGQHIDYQFYDDTDKTNVGNAIEVDGRTDETLDTRKTVKVPKGYDLAENQTIPTSEKLSADNPDLGKTITIHLVHHIDHNVSVDKNPSDSKTDANGFSETVTRTITAHEPQADGTFKDIDLSQHATLTRSGDYDEVLKKIVSWNDWSTGTFGQVSAPSLTGYTAKDNATIAADMAKDGYVDPKLVITYAADSRHANYQFVDDENGGSKVGSIIVVNGVTNQKNVATGLTVPTNYELADDQTLPISVDFGTEDPATVVIHLVHKIAKGVTKTPSSGAHTANNKDVKDADFSETITRTITAHEPQADGSFKDVMTVQKVTLTRTGNFDEVTKVLTWNDWSKGTFEAYAAPNVDGYTPSQAQVAKEDNVTDGYKDPNIKITYAANDQTETIRFWDDTENRAISSKTLNGVTDQRIDTGLTAPAGYELVEGNSIPSTYKFKAEGNGTITVHFKHGSKEIKPGDNIPKGNDPTQGQPENNVKTTDSQHTLKRIIKVNNPDGTTINREQDIAFQRTGHIDTVTGEVSWNAWIPVDSTQDSFAEYDAPTIAGYTPNKKADKEDNVAYSTDNEEVTISYTANAQHISYQFIDDDESGASVGSAIEVDGHTDETVDPSTKVSVPMSYKLAKGQSIPTSVKLNVGNSNLGKIIAIHLQHITKQISENDIPSGAKNVDGSLTSKKNFEEQLTRTITAQEPQSGGTIKATDLSQKITIKQTATYDEVTGVVKYNGDWSTGIFAKVDAPSIAGYTPSQTSVAEARATEGYTDPQIIIFYTKNDSDIRTVTFKFIDDDENDAEIGGDHVLSGQIGHSMNTNFTVPDGYKLANGQSLPKRYTIEATNTTVEIHFIHVISLVVGPSNLPKAGDKIPGTNKTYPSEATQPDSFNSSVKRTVTINIPGHNTQIISQEIDFTRTATIDAVTGKIKYSDWQVEGNDQLNKVDASVVKGYIASTKGAAEIDNIKQGQKVDDVVINYSKIGNFVPVDTDGNPIAGTSPVPYENDSIDPTKAKADENVPTISGYIPESTTVTPIDPTKDTKVVYTSGDQNVTIRFWDDTDKKEIGSDHVLRGSTNQTININLTAPTGYDLVAGNSIPLTYQFKAEGNDSITVHFVHHIDKGITNIPAGGAHDQNGRIITDSDFSETVKRTIIAHEPTRDVDLSQTATLTRTGNYDAVTKVITWNAWSTAGFAAVNAPTVDGYTSNRGLVAADTAKDGYVDPNISITYIKNTNPSGTDNPVSPSDNDNQSSVPNNDDNSNTDRDQDQEYDLVFINHNHHFIARISHAIKGYSGQVLTPAELKPILKKYLPKGWLLAKGYLAKGLTLRNREVVIQVIPATYRMQVLFIGRQGRIVKRAYITVNRRCKINLRYLASLARAKRPKGFHLTYKIKLVGNHVDVWVSRKWQLPRRRLTNYKVLCYFVLPSGKIVKQTYLRQPVSKQKLYQQMCKKYNFVGRDRVQNHLDIWLKDK